MISIDYVTLLLMRLLNTSTLCVYNFIMRIYSTLVILCFCGNYMVGKFLFFTKNNVTIVPCRSTSRIWGVSTTL
jgi:hypothetical protein